MDNSQQCSRPRARKSFRRLVQDIDTRTSEVNEMFNSSHDDRNHSLSESNTSGSVKKKRRHYKGSTYELYLSKKKKKKHESNKEGDAAEDSNNSDLNKDANGDIEYSSAEEIIQKNKIDKKDHADELRNRDISPKATRSRSTRSLSRNRMPDEDSQEPVNVGNVCNEIKTRSKDEDTVLENGTVAYTRTRKSKPPKSTNSTSDLDLKNRKILLRISNTGSIDSSTSDINPPNGETIESDSTSDDGKQDTCCCGDKPVNSKRNSEDKTMFCQAIDCFDGKLIGCCNQGRLPSLFRPSIRVPFRIYCEVHLARLRRHHCCPGCGLFCTQGQFLECFAVRKQIHLFHKNCQSVQNVGPNKQICPHCGKVSEINCVRLEMNGSINESSYFLSQSTIFKVPKAKITLNRLKELPIRLEANKDTGVEFCIPDTKRILSSCGIPYGLERKQLETLLTTLSNNKQTPSIRFTNKNFYAVAKAGEIDKVVSLLTQGFDPNYTYEENNHETPLHAAASAGHLVIVHLLVQAGANLNVMNGDMNTPLIVAIENKHHSIVKYLIRAGADHEVKGHDGMTALHVAAKNGNAEAVSFIVENRGVDINLQDDGGWTPLVWATEHKHLSIVKILLSKGAEPNIQDDEGNIGIHWACYSGEVNIAYIFLELGCDIDSVNCHGDTPLHIAARRDNYDCIVLLISRGADLTVINKNDETPLMCCAENTQSSLALKVNEQLRRFASKKKTMSDKYLGRDVSKGKEFYQIPIVNGYDNELIPDDYRYITENCETSPISINRTIHSLQYCTCKDDCTSGNCMCATISFRLWYDREGKLLPNFNLSDPPMIFECNRACACWKTCHNRVVQFGIRARLEVFRTKGKGWGIRPLRDIPKGTFVCEYVGELITDSEADRREDDSYLFDLDNKDGETYCLDARFYGNVARFINHQCDPNLTPVKVFVDHQDLSFPRIALFANRDIKAYEELGFDYGEKFWVIKYRWFTCDCSSMNCKYSKDVIHQTLENYYSRMRGDSSPRENCSPHDSI